MSQKTTLYYLIGVTASLGLMIAGYVVWNHSPVLLDDAFISYRYADNLIHGHGLVFNPGERVEGYTNFLWVLLAAISIKFHLDPLMTTRILGISAYLLTIGFCSWFLFWNTSKTSLKELIILPLMIILFLPEGPAALAGSGLETPFVALLILLLGITQHVWYPKSTLMRGGVALIPLIACLTRLDTTLFIASSACITFFDTYNRTGQGRDACEKVVRRFAITAMGLAIYLLWKKFYYHEIIPNSYYAKAADQWNIEVGATYLKTYLQGSPHLLLLLPFLLSAPFIYWSTPLRGFTLFSTFSLLLYGVYVLKVGGDFMHYRFMFEIYPLTICLAALGLLEGLKRLWKPALICIILAVGLSTTPPLLEKRFAMQSLPEMNDYVRVGKLVGECLGATMPHDTVIATTLAGTISYYSKLTTIDQWGINDPMVARQPSHPITYRGHVKFAPVDYLQSRGVNLYLKHPVICSCANPCIENLPNVFIRLRDDECLRTWYLVQKPELTAHFCAHPDNFLLHNVTCPAG